ncbi:MAG: hypothetical protein H0T48_00050 [Gemmatimonadaceae bacterium]|nr:hypothetical protein [Gemmatimonadaceae bacterium]
MTSGAQTTVTARVGVRPARTVAEGSEAEPWTGPDKVKHFFVAAFVESFGFAGLQAMGAGRGAALTGAIAATAAAAVGREIYDRRAKGVFSPSDLAWDAAGAAAALLVLTRTQR